MEGEFPEKYVDETRRLINFYSRAEGVNADIYTE